MSWCLIALGVLAVSALLVVASAGSSRMAGLVGLAGALTGAALTLVGALSSLGQPPQAFLMAWTLPYGAFSLWLDPLAAFFLALVLGVSLPISLYQRPYLEHHLHGRSSAPRWCFYNLFLACMMLVVLAHDAMLFLLAWEGMTLASYFLVTTDHASHKVRAAGNLYLICSHVGVSCLLAFFLQLGFDFSSPHFSSASAVMFCLAVAGFGLKLGLMPLHIWLPEAHPAAPSPVSAAMSGLMVKMGLYGLLRTLSLTSGPIPAWWGWLLLLAGLASALYGVLFALTQSDLKRMLAYSTIENVGLLVAGLGLATLARSYHAPTLAALALGAVLWHALSHALSKSLLFLGAGSVIETAGTGNLDRLGGLLKGLPRTGLAVWVGCLTMMALPPLSGFYGELMLGMGAFSNLLESNRSLQLAGILTLLALALVAGLAVATFTKLFGVIWLGEPRTDGAREAQEPARDMVVSLQFLAAACLGLGVAAPAALGTFPPMLDSLAPEMTGAFTAPWAALRETVTRADLAGCALVWAVLLLAALRRRALAGKPVGSSTTWDCGYTLPSPTMQYTGTSFSHPLVRISRGVLKTSRRRPGARGLFPESYAVSTHTPDACTEQIYTPLAGAFLRLTGPLRRLQHGNLNVYVLYILVALAVSWVYLEGGLRP